MWTLVTDGQVAPCEVAPVISEWMDEWMNDDIKSLQVVERLEKRYTSTVKGCAELQ